MRSTSPRGIGEWTGWTLSDVIQNAKPARQAGAVGEFLAHNRYLLVMTTTQTKKNDHHFVARRAWLSKCRIEQACVHGCLSVKVPLPHLSSIHKFIVFHVKNVSTYVLTVCHAGLPTTIDVVITESHPKELLQNTTLPAQVVQG